MRGLGLCCVGFVVSLLDEIVVTEEELGVFLNAHYAIVLPEPFQNGTVFNSLVMPAVRGKIRVHREMVFPKEGGLLSSYHRPRDYAPSNSG